MMITLTFSAPFFHPFRLISINFALLLQLFISHPSNRHTNCKLKNIPRYRAPPFISFSNVHAYIFFYTYSSIPLITHCAMHLCIFVYIFPCYFSHLYFKSINVVCSFLHIHIIYLICLQICSTH